MGMRVNTGSGIDPQLVKQLMELEKRPVQAVEERKSKVVEEQKSFRELTTLVSELGTAVQNLRTKGDFYKLKLESSHPDIIDGTVDGNVMPGSYELEVRGLAKTQKLLADSFPDKDETPVGYGYMSIELEDGSTYDIDIDPDRATLQDVVNQINDAQVGVKAMVLNTKQNLEDPEEENFRLLVISEKSGKQAKVYIDPDTTYLEFKEQVTGRNLEVLFEDVPVYSENNTLESLMPGMVLNAKRAEPGTKVQVNISFDVDATLENIKKFVESYNKVNEFLDKQFQVDPQTNRAGTLSRDNTLRTLRRSLQSAIQYQSPGGVRNLADLGITSDSKNGSLKLDETKAKQVLSENYEGAAKLFVQSREGPGFGTRLSDSIRAAQNAQGGVLASKEREFNRVIKTFDNDIERKERIAESRAEAIKRRFASLEQLIGGLNAQGQALQARMGPAAGGGG